MPLRQTAVFIESPKIVGLLSFPPQNTSVGRVPLLKIYNFMKAAFRMQCLLRPKCHLSTLPAALSPLLNITWPKGLIMTDRLQQPALPTSVPFKYSRQGGGYLVELSSQEGEKKTELALRTAAANNKSVIQSAAAAGSVEAPPKSSYEHETFIATDSAVRTTADTNALVQCGQV